VKLRTNHPDSAEANHALARVLEASSRTGEALTFAEIAAKLQPDNPEYLVFLGGLLRSVALFEHALPLLQKAHRIAPQAFETNIALARFYFDAANGIKALEYFERALEAPAAEANKKEALFSHAMCLISTGDSDKAESMLMDLMSSSKQRVPALVQLAQLGSQKSQSERAGMVREELARRDLNNIERRDLNLVLGKLHE